MKKYLKILAFLMVYLAKKVNNRLKQDSFGNSIFWGFIFVNCWLSLVIMELIMETISPGVIERLHVNRFINSFVILVVIFMIIEFFIFFSKDQWREFIPEIEQMDRQKRRKLCWRVIWFLIVAVPLSIILLVITMVR